MRSAHAARSISAHDAHDLHERNPHVRAATTISSISSYRSRGFIRSAYCGQLPPYPQHCADDGLCVGGHQGGAAGGGAGVCHLERLRSVENVLDAMRNYDVRPVAWSDREEAREELAA